jgi:hypothetical protein
MAIMSCRSDLGPSGHTVVRTALEDLNDDYRPLQQGQGCESARGSASPVLSASLGTFCGAYALSS